MRQTAQGPRDGVGAKLVWTGNDKVGSGTQLITGDAPIDQWRANLTWRWGREFLVDVTADAPGTRVTWTLDLDMGASPIGHYFGLTMDRMLGTDFAAA